MSQAVGPSFQQNQRPEPSFWEAPWEFAVHTLVGTLIFAIIAAPAVALNVGLQYLEAKYHIGSFVAMALMLAEYGVLVTDLILFAVFLWRTAVRTIRKL